MERIKIGCKVAVGLCLFALLTGCASTQQQTRNMVLKMDEANRAYEQGQCEIAIPLYRQLADSLRDDVESLLRLGNCQVRLQQLDAAAGTYKEALSRDPKFVKAWYNLSQVQARQLALTVTQMSAAIDPQDPTSNRIRELSQRVLQAFEDQSEVRDRP